MPQNQIPGLLVPGNIDLDNRPVVRNADGSLSTEYSVSFGIDGGREGAARGLTPEQIANAQAAVTPDQLAEQAKSYSGVQVEENPERVERRQERTLEHGMAASGRTTNPQAQMPF